MSSHNNWWETAAALRISRKAVSQSSSGVRLGDTFLIVTEGTVTEPMYFKCLRDVLMMATVDVEIISGDRSHPYDVIETAARMVASRNQEMNTRRQYQSFCRAAKYDHVWAVIDADVIVEENIWPEVTRRASKYGIKIAPSNPCFEFWLLLHQRLSSASIQNGTAAKKLLREQGFDCSSERAAIKSIPKLVELFPKAVDNARMVRNLNSQIDSKPLINPSTEVDVLICELESAIQYHRRKIKKSN